MLFASTEARTVSVSRCRSGIDIAFHAAGSVVGSAFDAAGFVGAATAGVEVVAAGGRSSDLSERRIVATTVAPRTASPAPTSGQLTAFFAGGGVSRTGRRSRGGGGGGGGAGRVGARVAVGPAIGTTIVAWQTAQRN